MTAKRTFFCLPAILILALATLFLVTSPVHAQGELPPPDAPAVEAPVEAPAADPAGEEVSPPVEESEPVEPVMLPTEPPADAVETPAAAAEEPSQPLSEGETVEDVPAETVVPDAPELVVVDPNGEQLPLATAEASQALASPDPYFYVGTTRYRFLKMDGDCGADPNCFNSNTPIQDAFDYIRDNALSPVGGAVYVESGEYTENISLDGSAVDGFGVLRWKTIPTSLALIGVKPATLTVPEKTPALAASQILHGSVTVSNMKSFTLQGFTIDANTDGSAVAINNCTGTFTLNDVIITNQGTGNGLDISSVTGPVNLTMVSSSGTKGLGAYIDNYVAPTASAPVTIKNSSFNGNKGVNLMVASGGSITLTGVTANNSETAPGASVMGFGVTINQSSFNGNAMDGLIVSPHAKGGNLSIQNSQFNNNGVLGLNIGQRGNVDIKNIAVRDNRYSGASIDTCIGSPCINTAAGNVTISQSNFTGNSKGRPASSGAFGGLIVLAKGAITLTDVYAGGNGDATHSAYGAMLQNTSGVFAVNLTNSGFDGNFSDGIKITTNGAVTLKDLTALINTGYGAYINNAVSASPAGITLSNSPDFTNIFSGNSESGLAIFSKGTVTVTGALAERNTGSGISITNVSTTAAVTVDGAGVGNANENGVDGIVVNALGAITIKNTNAERNTGYGLNLDNHSGTGAVTVSTSLPVWINGYYGNHKDGLRIQSGGAVTILNVETADNYHYGAYIDNHFGNGGVTITGSRFNHNNQRTPTDPNEYGLYVLSKGAITLTNVMASGNGVDLDGTDDDVVGNGARLDNFTTGGTKNVTITKGTFNENFGNGLSVVSGGAIIINTGSTNHNNGSGSSLDNSGALAVPAVTISALNSSSNVMGFGLQIFSKGSVTITASDFSENTGFGANINNAVGTNGGVSISGASNWWRSISNNGSYGLSITTNGAVNLNYLHFNHNTGGYGAEITIMSNTPAATLNNVDFSENEWHGLRVASGGNVTITEGNFSGNKNYGALINNSAGTGSVTLKSTNGMNINNNLEEGLWVVSKGAITLTNVDISNNGDDTHMAYGAQLDNSAGTNAAVTITGTAAQRHSISNNTSYGLQIKASGPVTINYMNVTDNTGSYGVDITSSGTKAAITIGNGEIARNDNYGLTVNALGSITVDNVNVYENKIYGMSLDNIDGAGTVTVRATVNGQIARNTGFGISVLSKGSITFTNIEIRDNTGYGAQLQNDLGTAAAVTINNSMPLDWTGNGTKAPAFMNYGLTISSSGAVTINDVNANGNQGENASITNATAAAPAVTITNSEFNDSKTSSGLTVTSNGNITLTHVNVRNNSKGDGAVLNNGGAGGKGSVTISGLSREEPNQFSDNSGNGLFIASNGAVTGKFIEASGNGGYGANIDNDSAASAQPVTLTTTTFDRNAQSVDGYGLNVTSKGNISLTEISASNNGNISKSKLGSGMFLDNCREDPGHVCTGTGNISLTNGGASDNNGQGIGMYTSGNISVTNGSARSNIGLGADFINTADKPNPKDSGHPLHSTGTVTITTTRGAYYEAAGKFNNNGGYGFRVVSYGAITITGVTANDNKLGLYAAEIINKNASTPQPVTITRSKFNNNSGANGVVVESIGAITFSNNEVVNNHGLLGDDQAGALLSNHTAPTPQNVTISSGVFNGNSDGSGLMVSTKGNITLTNITAMGNGDEGFEVYAGYGAGTITLNGTRNAVIGNTHIGAVLTGNGNISVSNLTSELNDYGLYVDTNTLGKTAAGNLTVTNTNLNKNLTTGFFATTHGSMTLSNLSALGNGIGSDGHGAQLSTDNKDITISNSAFMHNGASGLMTSTGAANTLTLTASCYIGNDADNHSAKNLIYDGKIILN